MLSCQGSCRSTHSLFMWQENGLSFWKSSPPLISLFLQFDMQRITLEELKHILFYAFRDHLTMKDIENIIINEEESLKENSGNCQTEFEGGKHKCLHTRALRQVCACVCRRQTLYAACLCVSWEKVIHAVRKNLSCLINIYSQQSCSTPANLLIWGVCRDERQLVTCLEVAQLKYAWPLAIQDLWIWELQRIFWHFYSLNIKTTTYPFKQILFHFKAFLFSYSGFEFRFSDSAFWVFSALGLRD